MTHIIGRFQLTGTLRISFPCTSSSQCVVEVFLVNAGLHEAHKTVREAVKSLNLLISKKLSCIGTVRPIFACRDAYVSKALEVIIPIASVFDVFL